VAIKVLPESLAQDTGRLLRFQQEAQVLRALNHPNLLAIFDGGTENGTNYLVPEFLDGQTPRERMNEGALPLGAARPQTNQRKMADREAENPEGLGSRKSGAQSHSISAADGKRPADADGGTNGG
jgi:hypothetical protein